MSVRAVQADRPGGPEVLEVREVPAPETGPSQILVRTVASSLNPIDRKMRGRETLTFPLTLGWDLAGMVVDSDVSRFKPGDRVIAMIDPLLTGIGAWSDLVALDADVVAFAPDRAALTEAATLPLAGLTALQAWNKLSLHASSRVLVAGAAGAIGGFLVQLAVRDGHAVDGLVSRPSHLATVKSLGAELVTDDLEALPEQGYDAIVDTVGLTAVLGRFVTADGHYVVTSKEQPDLPRSHPVRVAADAGQLGQLARMVDAGELRLRVSAHYGLYDVHDAHWHFEAGGLLGKVVLVF